MKYISLFLLAALTLAHTAAAREPIVLDRIVDDWTPVVQYSTARHLPIVLLVTSAECGYCELLKKDVLRPMQRSGALEEQAIVREMHLDAGGKIVDFDGEKVRARLFLRRYEVFATPTLLFLDKDGRPLHEPLVGFNGRDNYLPLLTSALTQSRAALEQFNDETRKLAGDSSGLGLSRAAAN